MSKAILFNFLVDKENKKINVERSFDAPLELVWAAWTEADILDQWWAPKPYQATTKSLDLREGGSWLYAMEGPEGDKHWCLATYKKIKPKEVLSWEDAFCDETGSEKKDLPNSLWVNTFKPNAGGTTVAISIAYKELTDLERILEMGFKEGFSAGLENLDQYIKAQFYLRKQNRPATLPRVASYVNFPGNTEEAFNFYKSVFKTEFINGIHRLGDIPAETGHPPVADAVKKMILHIELPLIGGHILMGTDAPKEMGFTVTPGNNMHFHLEPESKEEADRLFNELSAGGKVEIPIQDMFWGAYYGNFQDKYGINWMINYRK
jgi:uncharacterized glyoxalase superfamily protein PhnB/uncharacterized protein YndB with AHSA1/START domain